VIKHQLKLVLANKRVLLIAPNFFGYEKAIIDALTQYGASVDFLPDRPFKNHVARGLSTIWGGAASLYSRYLIYKKHLQSWRDKNFDYILIINGQTCSSEFIDELRGLFKSACFLLYIWDSVRNRPNSISIMGKFDRVFTFDPVDASEYRLRFRPLFFLDRYQELLGSRGQKYCLSFIGTMHSDRYLVSKRVFAQIPHSFEVYKYFYVQSWYVYLAKKLTRVSFQNSRISEFNFSPLSGDQIDSVFRDSLCILDIEHPRQSGLTIRSLEALGAGKKLVTTNATIVKYDFFCPDNILVINRDFPEIPDSFLRSSYKPLPFQVYEKYSVAGWLHTLFCSSGSGL
jgi:hypothetical protein